MSLFRLIIELLMRFYRLIFICLLVFFVSDNREIGFFGIIKKCIGVCGLRLLKVIY